MNPIFFVLLFLGFLIGCSSTHPNPSPLPTPVPETNNIPTLTNSIPIITNSPNPSLSRFDLTQPFWAWWDYVSEGSTNIQIVLYDEIYDVHQDSRSRYFMAAKIPSLESNPEMTFEARALFKSGIVSFNFPLIFLQ